MKLSVVIPAYNEEVRLKRSLPIIIKFLDKKFSGDYEIIVVDDGSCDKTRYVVQKFKDIILTKPRENCGKGYSVREGMLKAKGDFILFADSDLSTPITELEKFMKYLKGYDVVIGSRALRDSQVKTRWHKKLLGRVSNMMISVLVIRGIKDTQCGFKLFKKDAVKDIFSKQTINGWGFDFEVLFLAKKFGYKIKEVGVLWIEDEDSKVKITDYPKTLAELINIRYNDIRGVYGSGRKE